MSILLCITPGADWAYLIASALKNRSPLPALFGMLAGHLSVILIVVAGVGILIAGQPWLLTLLTVAGSLYLIWMGVGMIRTPASVRQRSDVSAESPRRQFLKGMGVSGLNPKVFLLIMVILPQFTDPALPLPVGVQMLANGFLHLINTTVVYLGVGYFARSLLRTRPGAARIVSYISGAAMIVVGAVMLVQRVFELF